LDPEGDNFVFTNFYGN